MQLWDTWCPHKFDYQDYDFVSGKDLDLDTVEMLASENFYFGDIGFLHCNQDPVPWDEFLEGLSEQKPHKPSSRRSATGKRITDEDLVQLPWLPQYSKKSFSDKPSSSSTHGSTSKASEQTGTHEDIEELTDEMLDEVWDRLAHKRQEWLDSGFASANDFEHRVLGGVWTKKHKGLVCDRVMVGARTNSAKQ